MTVDKSTACSRFALVIKHRPIPGVRTMSRLILPTSQRILKGDWFKWSINGADTHAESTLLQLVTSQISGKKFWDILGWTGQSDDGNLFLFGFTIPYINDDTFSKKYTVADGLSASLMRTVKLPNGFIELVNINPEGGLLDIEELNPKEGHADGKFQGLFHENGKLLDVKIQFHLTRVDV